MEPLSSHVLEVLPHLASIGLDPFSIEWGWASELRRPRELIWPLLPPGSVEVAVAVLLVTCIVVVVAILGYCFIKNQRKSFHRHHHRRPPPPTPTSSTVSTTEDTEHLVYNHTTRPL